MTYYTLGSLEATEYPPFFNYLTAGVGTEDFESFSLYQGTPLALTFPGAGTATLNGEGYVERVTSGTNDFGRYPISGDQYWETTDSFWIDFSDPTAAFGFYAIDIGDFSGNVTLTLENGTTETFIMPNTTNGLGGSVVYYAIINTDNLFTRATFGNTAAGVDYFAFDDMTIGSIEQVTPGGGGAGPGGIVPEPSPTSAPERRIGLETKALGVFSVTMFWSLLGFSPGFAGLDERGCNVEQVVDVSVYRLRC